LIVCEGSKTEPNYLDELRAVYRLSSAHIKIVSCSTGTAPIQIVEDAERQCREQRTWDRVFCVFDMDDHQSFQVAKSKAQALNLKMKSDEHQQVPFFAVTSVPCFELWLLLHFELLSREENRDFVQSAVRRHLPRYTKGASGTFTSTRHLVSAAFDNALTLREQRKRTGRENPGTEMDILTRFLIEVGEKHFEMIAQR
jgi:hypothetical protein